MQAGRGSWCPGRWPASEGPGPLSEHDSSGTQVQIPTGVNLEPEGRVSGWEGQALSPQRSAVGHLWPLFLSNGPAPFSVLQLVFPLQPRRAQGCSEKLYGCFHQPQGEPKALELPDSQGPGKRTLNS